MKRLIASALLFVTSLGVTARSFAEAKSVALPLATESAGKSSVAGQFTGKWKSTADEGGDLRMKLTQDAAGVWSAEVTFTIEQKAVVTTMKSVKVDGVKITLMFEWPMDENTGKCKVTGELTGDTLKGTYESSAGNDTSRGTWTVTRS